MSYSLHTKYIFKILVLFLTIFFFLINLNRLDYGLPFFINLDENVFQYSTLSFLDFITGYSYLVDPIYGPLLNLLLILNSIFINEFIVNSLSLEEIKLKIYFNPELFIFYGRISSLITTTISILILSMVFKKLKINFIIYFPLLITFTTSLVVFDIAIINGKHSFYLLFFLLQLYFFFKYLLKIQKFKLISYIIFGILGSISWGISYWPAFVSIYAIIILHLRKFKISKIHYILIFLSIFILLGPITGMIISDAPIFEFLISKKEFENLQIKEFYNTAIIDLLEGLKIIFFAEKNILLLLGLMPVYLINKNTKYKKEFFIILFIFLEPIFLFAIAQKPLPQLRYFAGNSTVILILISMIINELCKINLKKFYFIFLILNIIFVSINISLNLKVNSFIKGNHSFYKFNESINIDNNKILYLIDLGFQENLKQNKIYLELFENDLIKKTENHETSLKRLNNKINKIKNSKKIINNEMLKENITYYNYSYYKISNLKLFFDFIKKKYDYVIIEESRPFYLSDPKIQNEIKNFVKKNFTLEKISYDEEKIFLRSLRSIIHYYSNSLNRFDKAKNINNKNLDIVYGSNYGLYKLK